MKKKRKWKSKATVVALLLSLILIGVPTQAADLVTEEIVGYDGITGEEILEEIHYDLNDQEDHIQYGHEGTLHENAQENGHWGTIHRLPVRVYGAITDKTKKVTVNTVKGKTQCIGISLIVERNGREVSRIPYTGKESYEVSLQGHKAGDVWNFYYESYAEKKVVKPVFSFAAIAPEKENTAVKQPKVVAGKDGTFRVWSEKGTDVVVKNHRGKVLKTISYRNRQGWVTFQCASLKQGSSIYLYGKKGIQRSKVYETQVWYL